MDEDTVVAMPPAEAVSGEPEHHDYSADMDLGDKPGDRHTVEDLPEVVPTPAAATPPPQAPAQVPPAQPAVAAPQAPQPQFVPAQPGQPVPQQPQITPQEALLQQRENLVTEIAARYSMPDDVRNKFLMEPETVVPTMVARIYLDVFDAVYGTVVQQLPQLMGMREQQVNHARQTEDKFFGRWPSLKDPQFYQDIMSIGRAFRQSNPQATPEQTIEYVGAMVSVARGVQLPNAAPAPSPQYRPPVPVGPGASRSQAPANNPDNYWFDLMKEDDS
ncbi:MAG TPA: hypothetical protein VF077_00345 [Nitrospiraceae bacterium]